MEETSFIYKSIYVYRIILNILYFGKYNQRFKDVIKHFDSNTKSVTELCFGDIKIAKYCKKNAINWVGYDLSKSFVDFAKKKNYNANNADIMEFDDYSKSDLCVIIGSLYHFNSYPDKIFNVFFKISNTILISEPVKNLSSYSGFVGKMSHVLTNAGKGKEDFRFNEETIIQFLENNKNKYNFKYEILSIKKDILIKITKV
ncbi:MAG: hypothetical protein WCK02_04830 [Bacteroidota bacterium]